LEVRGWKLERRCESGVSFCLTWCVESGNEEKQDADGDEEENCETAEAEGADGQNLIPGRRKPARSLRPSRFFLAGLSRSSNAQRISLQTLLDVILQNP